MTEALTTEANKKSKGSKALGPDELSPVMLKHLGSKGLNFLTKIFNMVVNTANIQDEGSKYRPVSLLCPAAKLLESTLLPTVSAVIPGRLSAQIQK